MQEVGGDTKPYTELEYIESTGTQWIDSGFVPTVSSKLEITWQAIELQAKGDSVGTMTVGISGFVGGPISDGGDHRFVVGIDDTCTKLYYGLGAINNTFTIPTGTTLYDKFTSFIDLQSSTCGQNGTVYNVSNVNFRNPNEYSTYIFARRGSNEAAERIGKIMVFDVKFYNSGTLQKYFIPCKLKSNNEIGLWELVEDKFYGNDGTGTFIAGPVKDTSSKSTMNIFVQTTEPTTKKGIWLQTDETMENVTFEDDIVESETWYPDGTFTNVPYTFYGGGGAIVGTNVYLFGGTGNKTNNYKYNILTDTYTKMRDIPYEFEYGSVTAVGTDIYIFGGTTSNHEQNYKYDTLTDTYTKMTDMPYIYYNGSIVTVGTDIYILGSNTSNKRYNYKYNTLTDTYTRMTDIPYNFAASSAVSIGTNIYLLGSTIGSGNSQYNYKYNTLTDTYTRLTDIPYQFTQGKAIYIDTDIYIFGGNDNTVYNNAYKYNTLTDTWTQVTNIPYGFRYGSAFNVNKNIYLFGGQEYPTKVQCLQLNIINIDTDNTVVVSQGLLYNVGYRTELFTNNKCINNAKYSFTDAWFYTTNDGLITDIPTYYGNGTQWINFKNPPQEENN